MRGDIKIWVQNSFELKGGEWTASVSKQGNLCFHFKGSNIKCFPFSVREFGIVFMKDALNT